MQASPTRWRISASSGQAFLLSRCLRGRPPTQSAKAANGRSVFRASQSEPVGRGASPHFTAFRAIVPQGPLPKSRRRERSSSARSHLAMTFVGVSRVRRTAAPGRQSAHNRRRLPDAGRGCDREWPPRRILRSRDLAGEPLQCPRCESKGGFGHRTVHAAIAKPCPNAASRRPGRSSSSMSASSSPMRTGRSSRISISMNRRVAP
jgi:hypothetical protein